MKRITTNDDIRFPISVVKGLDSDVFTILFYTTSRSVNITKTNADVEDGGNIHFIGENLVAEIIIALVMKTKNIKIICIVNGLMFTPYSIFVDHSNSKK